MRITRLPDATVKTGGGSASSTSAGWSTSALIPTFPEDRAPGASGGDDGSLAEVHEEEEDTAESLQLIEARAERIRAELEKETGHTRQSDRAVLFAVARDAAILARDYGRLLAWALETALQALKRQWHLFRAEPEPIWRRLIPHRGLRAALNDHPVATLACVGSVLFASIVVALGTVGSAPAEEGAEAARSAFYYDLNAGELFVAPEQPAPIPAPSGPTADGAPAGVHARVFACGDCRVAENRFIGYLATRPRPVPGRGDKLHAGQSGARVTLKRDGDGDWRDQIVIRPVEVDVPKWVPRNSEAARTLNSLLEKRCQQRGRSLLRCYPADRSR